MIAELNGLCETIRYGGSLGFKLFHNNEYEDFPEHWHYGIEIIMPVHSGYTAIVGEERYELREGDVLLINSGVLHALEAPVTGERIIFQFDVGLLHTLKGMETLLFMLPAAHLITYEMDEVYEYVFLRMNKIVEEYDAGKAFWEVSVYAAILEMLVCLGRTLTAKELQQHGSGGKRQMVKQREYLEAVMNACGYMNQHYQENLTLEETAAISGFSKFHFTRIFKQFTNMTFYDYLNSKRINKAKELLYFTNMSITDVAMNAGFSSLSSFNRNFKALNQCSPSEYRNKSMQ